MSSNIPKTKKLSLIIIPDLELSIVICIYIHTAKVMRRSSAQFYSKQHHTVRKVAHSCDMFGECSLDLS